MKTPKKLYVSQPAPNVGKKRITLGEVMTEEQRRQLPRVADLSPGEAMTFIRDKLQNPEPGTYTARATAEVWIDYRDFSVEKARKNSAHQRTADKEKRRQAVANVAHILWREDHVAEATLRPVKQVINAIRAGIPADASQELRSAMGEAMKLILELDDQTVANGMKGAKQDFRKQLLAEERGLLAKKRTG